jgi:glutamyl-tRNA reductase
MTAKPEGEPSSSLRPHIGERVSSSASTFTSLRARQRPFARRLTHGGGEEAVVPSTRNRTEVYLAHSDPNAAAARAHAGLARLARALAKVL